jgi:UDP-N-acetylmuramoylalanine--D-glutamate ligase
MKLEGKYLGILGFGRTGRALKGLADRLGIKTFVSDLKEGDERENTYRILMCDVVSPSPGIPPHNRILSRVERSEIPIIPEIEIGWKFLRGKTVAITGTNGKSTTAYFTHRLIKGSYIGGNWGNPVSELAFKEGTFVLEISSFQLHYIREFKPDVAVITNISPDHLDWHLSFENYLRDKLKIFQNMDERGVSILNLDDENFEVCRAHARGKILKVSMFSKGADAYYENGYIYGDFGKLKVPNHLLDPTTIYNLMFAVLSAFSLGVREFDLESLKKLKGRVEFVDRVNNVEFYDDSKGTNPHATLYAIKGFDRVILIMGGDNKGLTFESLRDEVRKRVKKIIAMGKSAKLIYDTFSDIVEVVVAKDMFDAVFKAYEASDGEPVLLSPACASFDMFRDYVHRSEVFRMAIRKLKESKTSV